jgi:hypothetical protein
VRLVGTPTWQGGEYGKRPRTASHPCLSSLLHDVVSVGAGVSSGWRGGPGIPASGIFRAAKCPPPRLQDVAGPVPPLAKQNGAAIRSSWSGGEPVRSKQEEVRRVTKSYLTTIFLSLLSYFPYGGIIRHYRGRAGLPGQFERVFNARGFALYPLQGSPRVRFRALSSPHFTGVFDSCFYAPLRTLSSNEHDRHTAAAHPLARVPCRSANRRGG